MVRNALGERARTIALPQHVNQSALSNLDRQVDQAMLAKADVVALEMGGVQTMDSHALNWLLAAQTRLAAQGIPMMLSDPSTICQDILLATRLDHRFKVTYSNAPLAAEAKHV